MGEKRTRAKYTLEFKMEAVMLVRNGLSVSDVSKILGGP
jgi:transposase